MKIIKTKTRFYQIIRLAVGIGVLLMFTTGFKKDDSNKNDPAAYKDTYGALYNFHAVNDSRSLCPEGWHVPTKSDWLTLETYLGGRSAAGGKMKETGSTHWKSPNIGATNKSGFTGIPGGGRARLGWFGDVGEYSTWWSSTRHDATYAWHWGLSRSRASVRANPGHKASGFSVRCVKD